MVGSLQIEKGASGEQLKDVWKEDSVILEGSNISLLNDKEK
jgi:hypothetical protein